MNNKKQLSSDVLLEGYSKYGWVIPFCVFIFCIVFLILRRVDEDNSQKILSQTIIAAAPAQDEKQLMVRFEDIDIKPDSEPMMMNDPPVFINYGGKIYKELENGLYQDKDGGLWKKIKVSTTAYTWVDDGFDSGIGAGDGITSIGKCAIKTYGVAADPKAIPYGSTVHVAGYGVYKVDDTGGAMRKSYRKGEIRLDLRIPQKASNGQWRSISTCRNIARRHGYQQDREVLLKIR